MEIMKEVLKGDRRPGARYPAVVLDAFKAKRSLYQAFAMPPVQDRMASRSPRRS